MKEVEILGKKCSIMPFGHGIEDNDLLDFARDTSSEIFQNNKELRPVLIVRDQSSGLVVGIDITPLSKDQWASAIGSMISKGISDHVLLVSEIWMKVFEKEDKFAEKAMKHGLENVPGRKEAIMVAEYRGEKEFKWVRFIERLENGEVKLGDWEEISGGSDKAEGRLVDLHQKATMHERN